jgi:uncharacterized protein (TIGR02757 family)
VHQRPIRNAGRLKERLDELVVTFDQSTLTPDPLEVVLRYETPADREVAGLLAASFAYGRADIVVRNVSGVLERMGESPAEFLRRSFRGTAGDGAVADRRAAMGHFSGFTHRFHKTPDLVALLERIAIALHRFGTLGALFEQSYDRSDSDIGPSLQRFVRALIDGRAPSATERKSLDYLLTSPEGGSACKRMNLYLRWMVRPSAPDCGLWTFVDPAKLIIPLDTHVHRISAFLGLSERRTADWKTAREITTRLARFNRADPVGYDFAICRLGILDLCSRRRRKENCEVCLLRDVCRFPVTERELRSKRSRS